MKRFVRIGAPQRRLLDEVEAAITAIRYPCDQAEIFEHQVVLALQRARLQVTREMFMEGGRRVDVCVVDNRGTVVLELERDEPSRSTLAKMLDLPPEVLRTVVFRHRFRHAPIEGCDRIICVRSSLRMVPWLVDGQAILEERTEETSADMGQVSRTEAWRKREDARRVHLSAMGPRKGPQPSPSPAQVVVDTAIGRKDRK